MKNRFLQIFSTSIIAMFLLSGIGVSQDSKEEIREWVTKLGDSNFKVRSEANRRLLGVGEPALPALKAALKSNDREVTMRAHRLVEFIEGQSLRIRADQFATSDDPDSFNMPGWIDFKTRFGQSPATQQLYASMLKAEIRLLRKSALKESDVGTLFIQRLKESQPNLFNTNGAADDYVPRIAAFYFFFLGNPNVQLDFSTLRQLTGLMTRQPFQDAIVGSESGDVLKKLVASAIFDNEKIPDNYVITDALRLGIEGCEARARKTLKGPAPIYKSYALMYLGKYGEEKDKKLVESFMNSTDVVRTTVKNKNERMITTLGDVALAVLVFNAGKSAAEFGIGKEIAQGLQPFSKSSHVYVNLSVVGFSSESRRQAAREKWLEFQKKKNSAESEKEKK